MILKAPAKINLHLQVIKKRNDGFHDIRTAFELIDLYDIISIEPAIENITLKEEANKIKNNIILKAAFNLKKLCSVKMGADISLKKNIPMQMGLGGGSSDAAAVLLGLNKLWNTNLNTEELSALGKELGSDVPLFIKGTSSWGEGRGDILSEIIIPKRTYLLALPKEGISTKIAFDNIVVDSKHKFSLDDFIHGKKINDFQDYALKSSDEIRRTFDILQKYNKPMLTGTGSAIFIEFDNKKKANMVFQEIKKKIEVILVNSLDSSPLKTLLT